MKKILIFGFGRMGLTHYAILNQLIDNAEFVFVDPNRKLNYFAKSNLNAKILSSDKKLNGHYDIALICTPPMFHIPILESCLKLKIPNIFVEKPFGGVNDELSKIINNNFDISVGYVLRFNPIIQWIKNEINVKDITKVAGFFFSNTIERKPKGWRNGLYSGVTNEVGAHIIDLCVYLFGMKNPVLVNKKVNSVVSDVDDIISADLKEEFIDFHFHFDWVNKAYRKPVFKFEITMRDGSVFKFDQQKVEHSKEGMLINKITTVDLSPKVPFYLRGIDFTNQMLDFLHDKKIIATAKDAAITRNIIKNIISK
jgi:predicted dehydrogenase